jgi:S1-C subfamily serine protease
MNARPILIASILTLLTASLHAADTSDPEEASRAQIEHKMEQAEKRLEQATREISELSMQLNRQPWMGFGASRALLGINVGVPMPGTTDRTSGVRILSVSPGGPADVAGLKANDVIVSFQGKELRGDQTHTPRQQLLALMRDVGPDSPVAVEFQREGKLQRTQIVPKSLTGFVDQSVTRGLQGLGESMKGLDSLKDLESLKDLGSIMGMRDSSGFGSAEFLDLSPDLGRYFGTSKGLLVVRAPKDQRLELQDGDVILDIDGRIPTSGSHALQILNSYRAGETLKLHIMRQQKRVELPVEIPADHDHGD